MGTLTQKCIKRLPEQKQVSDEMLIKHNQNMTNWYMDDYGVALCGNMSGSRYIIYFDLLNQSN